MAVETTTEVEELGRVQNEDGERVAPATERAARQVCRNGNVVVANSAEDYSVIFDPDHSIYELLIFESGAETTVKITTTGGDEFSIPMRGQTATLDRWEIDTVEITDPNNAQTIAGWAGE
jgi:hypothetical protein